MDKEYLIRNTETGEYLTALYVGCQKAVPPLLWKADKNYAIPFENADVAQATITFIGDVIDWELSEQLTAAPMEEGRG